MLRRFARRDENDVVINVNQIVAVYPAVDTTQTVIVTTAVVNFSQSSGAMNFVVDLPLDAALETIGA